jgi:hypothetical protein
LWILVKNDLPLNAAAKETLRKTQYPPLFLSRRRPTPRTPDFIRPMRQRVASNRATEGISTVAMAYTIGVARRLAIDFGGGDGVSERDWIFQ